MSYNLLKGKKGIIFGALDERSIAWRTALRCHEEGAEIVLSNAPVAMRMGEINKLAEIVNAPVIACDVSSNEDVTNLITKTMDWRETRRRALQASSFRCARASACSLHSRHP